MSKLFLNKIKQFKQTIRDFYKKNKRDLPWRHTSDPYHILISEVMLQQTQVSRVLKKYPEFLKSFPTFKALSKASTKDVLTVWQGMGYNRRALYLKSTAAILENKFRGKLPQDPQVLHTFPGIGKATSCSVITFAFNKPTVFIETNIRRVFIHYFFKDKGSVSDKEILLLVEKTIDLENPREWYYALMDYGAMLGKTITNPNKRSKHYLIQSKFEGSNRQIRGAILKALLDKPHSDKELIKKFAFSYEKIYANLEDLKHEGFISNKKGIYGLKNT